MFMNKALLIGLMALVTFSIHAQDPTVPQMNASQLRAALAEAPELPLKKEEVLIQLPPNATLGGRIVSVTSDRKAGLTYVLVRVLGPAKNDHQPILVVDRRGHIVRSWGKDLFTAAHNIKIDSRGNVW